MKHSTDRILTTHAGRLDGPPEHQQMMRSIMSGAPYEANAVRPVIHNAMVDVVRKQADAGIDVMSDGEVGKLGFGGIGYYGRRLSGLSTRPVKPGEPPFMALYTGERLEFADFYKDLNFGAGVNERAVCSAPVTYIGREEVGQATADFRAALAEANVPMQEAFVCAL